jgi:hypothetical protein
VFASKLRSAAFNWLERHSAGKAAFKWLERHSAGKAAFKWLEHHSRHSIFFGRESPSGYECRLSGRFRTVHLIIHIPSHRL